MARKNGRGFSLFKKVWSPFSHLLMASEESGQKLGTTAGKIVKESIGAVRKVGNSFARHSNNAVKGLTRRRSSRRGASRRTATRRNACRGGIC